MSAPNNNFSGAFLAQGTGQVAAYDKLNDVLSKSAFINT